MALRIRGLLDMVKKVKVATVPELFDAWDDLCTESPRSSCLHRLTVLLPSSCFQIFYSLLPTPGKPLPAVPAPGSAAATTAAAATAGVAAAKKTAQCI